MTCAALDNDKPRGRTSEMLTKSLTEQADNHRSEQCPMGMTHVSGEGWMPTGADPRVAVWQDDPYAVPVCHETLAETLAEPIAKTPAETVRRETPAFRQGNRSIPALHPAGTHSLFERQSLRAGSKTRG
jgi:hypothetical protein